MTQGRLSRLRRGQVGLLAESLVWAFVVAAIYAGIGTLTDWRMFEPETLDDYRYIISERWSFVLDYLAWIGLPLIAIVWGHSRYVGKRPVVPHHAGDEYRALGLRPSEPRGPVETFAYLYLGAMAIAGLGRFAIVRCWMRGQCDFFIWYQALLYSTVFLIWPLLLLLLRLVIWRAIRRR